MCAGIFSLWIVFVRWNFQLMYCVCALEFSANGLCLCAGMCAETQNSYLLASVTDRGLKHVVCRHFSRQFVTDTFIDCQETQQYLTELYYQDKTGQHPTARYVSGFRGCRCHREQNVNEASLLSRILFLAL